MLILKKQPERDFVLLNLSDPQLSDGEWAEEHPNHKIFDETVKTLVERIKPDLITVSGDIAWAGNNISYRRFAEYLDAFGIPWAPVWGNHDNQGGEAMVDAVADEYLSHPLCMYEKGDPKLGNGNYIIGIEEEGKLVSAVFMLDSHDRMPYVTPLGQETLAWAKLIPEQLDWYREQVRELEKQGCRDSVIIMHIPNYAYREAFAAAWKSGVDQKSVKPEDSTGSAYWNEGYTDSYGVEYEGIGSYEADDGVMDVVTALGSTKHIIAGHDHINNTVITYRGVKLIYSLKCGAGCYWDPILNGGTVLSFNHDGAHEVRHEFVDVSALLG